MLFGCIMCCKMNEKNTIIEPISYIQKNSQDSFSYFPELKESQYFANEQSLENQEFGFEVEE